MRDTRVGVVGTGAIGAAVARTLLGAGRDVVVWNRTARRSAASVEAGAVPAGSVREAVTAGSLTFVTVTGYAAVHDCLAQADADLSGRTVVVLCTGTPADARAAADRVASLGADYLDGGVQTAPEDVGTGAATILYSGSATAFDRYRDTFGLLGTPRFVSTDVTAAASWDLALFGLWYDAQLGLLRALDMVRSVGIEPGVFAETAAVQLGHVVDATAGTAAEMQAAEYPRGPADLDEHLPLLRRLVETRRAARLGDGGLATAVELAEDGVTRGHGGSGLTALVAADAE